MKSPLTKATGLIGEILSVGIRAWVMGAVIEAVLFCIAVFAGLAVWLGKDFSAGLATGFVVFVIGQVLVVAVLEVMCLAPEREAGKNRLPADDEVIRSLRSELEATPESATPNRPPE